MRCHAGMADYIHVACHCPDIARFGGKGFCELSSIVGAVIELDQMLALLGYDREVEAGSRKLMAIGLLLAKCREATRWVKGPAPTIKAWQSDMVYCNTQSDVYNELLPPASRSPKNYWSPFQAYLVGKEMGEPEGDHDIEEQQDRDSHTENLQNR